MTEKSQAWQVERIEELRVLVVEPNAELRKILRDILLRGIGVQHVAHAANGKDAIAQLRETPSDVILADADTAPVGAVELTQKVRAGLPGSDPFLPVIVMSARPSIGEIIAARDAGANDYLAKPLSVKILDLRLRALVARPRPFVRSDNFFGPDRRRHPEDGFNGRDRREQEPDLIDVSETS